jgi:hypothetical protein
VETPKSIVYMFHNPETDQAYFGSTEYPLRRKWDHLSKLKHNKHPNGDFQEAFNGNPNFEFIPLHVENMDEARELEARLIKDHSGHPGLLNITLNSGKPQSRELSGNTGRYPRTEDHRKSVSDARSTYITEHGLRQSVVINGVVYPSLSAAANALGMNVGTVQHRVRSQNFGEWQYSQEPFRD